MKKKIRQMKPEDLPEGVITTLGSDNRGHCYMFDHVEYGCLGRLVMIPVAEDKQRLEYDFFEGDEEKNSPNYLRRMEIFQRTVYIINQAFDENFHSIN